MAKSYQRVASQTTMSLRIPNWKSSHKGEDEWVGWRLDKSSRQRISGYRKSNVGRDKRVMSCGFIGPGIRPMGMYNNSLLLIFNSHRTESGGTRG